MPRTPRKFFLGYTRQRSHGSPFARQDAANRSLSVAHTAPAAGMPIHSPHPQPPSKNLPARIASHLLRARTAARHQPKRAHWAGGFGRVSPPRQHLRTRPVDGASHIWDGQLLRSPSHVPTSLACTARSEPYRQTPSAPSPAHCTRALLAPELTRAGEGFDHRTGPSHRPPSLRPLADM